MADIMIAKPLTPKTIPCKICGHATEIQGCLDFGRACTVASGVFFPLTGIPVYYHRCSACGFIFTIDFDSWSYEDFLRNIYNDEYSLVDPEYANGVRAKRSAPLASRVIAQLGAIDVLDYGGGNGALTNELRSMGVNAISWDPLIDGIQKKPKSVLFDFICAFEVFEHTPTPIETTNEILSLLKPGGRLLMSTGVVDNIPPQNLDWWYFAPRNGHISFHTMMSLAIMFKRFDRSVKTIGLNTFLIE
jgi:2-polyprenyl-3-methyl-5-hydroxy-6-metoxy-1,4-benzoquinol methylase